ncbi:ATP-binding cassette domain-containing protein [Fictibacillus sp. NRS-1165]|uniref:ATP-binding cassette domain-containing protein n=1 Tax=Fictibacillus sp. NRS-1165 TaxID=3144463 RepID=UPI003D1B818D
MSILSVEYLTHKYGDQLNFKDICFLLLPREHAGLAGRNGTGKSTLLKSLLMEYGKLQDAQSKQALKEALVTYEGAVLPVSHEPDFYKDWVTHVSNIEDWRQEQKSAMKEQLESQLFFFRGVAGML